MGWNGSALGFFVTMSKHLQSNGILHSPGKSFLECKFFSAPAASWIIMQTFASDCNYLFTDYMTPVIYR